jgi:glycosyltransferase involved in cell wall biosynthesis
MTIESLAPGNTQTNVAISEGEKRLKSPKRYLFVLNEIGFLYSHFWSLASAIQQAGWDVMIAAREGAGRERAIEAGMHFIPLQLEIGIRNPLAEIRSAAVIREAIRSCNPDVLHLISLKNVLIGGIIARLEKCPAVLGQITGLGTLFVEERISYKVLRPLVLLGLRFAFAKNKSALAVENSDDKNFLLKHGVSSTARTVVIPGSGLDQVPPPPPRPCRRVPVILCVCRMIRNKGIFQLVEAAKMMTDRGLRFAVHLVGDVDQGNPTSMRKDELETLSNGCNVAWLGHRSDVFDLLLEADIFCLPTYYREGLPRSLTEACAAGLPIVTTDVPGCREVVVNDANGYLVPPQNSEALARALSLLVESSKTRERMGAESRRRFEELFSTPSVLGAFAKCHSVLGAQIPIV